MTLLEWILLLLVSAIIFFIGFAGVTGTYIFGRKKDDDNSEEL